MNTKDFKGIFRSVKRQYKLLFGKLSILCIGQLSRIIGSRIVLAFNATAATDGTGAQIQRLLSVRACAAYLDMNYKHNDIQTVSVHPLDPFQTQSELEAFLKLLNNRFHMDSTPGYVPASSTRRYKSLNLLQLVRAMVQSTLTTKVIELEILDAYAITEYVDLTKYDFADFLPNYYSNSAPRMAGNTRHIVVHYRQGVGGYAIYPGQNIPREIDFKNFASRIQKLVNSYKHECKITVLTDAPSHEIQYVPLEQQKVLWEGSPNYEAGSIRISGKDFSVQLSEFGVPYNIISGGSPLEAIVAMSNADFLLMSRSSLSYVGALLNRDGLVFYPPQFWHRPLKNWKPL
jgi:hypothetical protein